MIYFNDMLNCSSALHFVHFGDDAKVYQEGGNLALLLLLLLLYYYYYY